MLSAKSYLISTSGVTLFPPNFMTVDLLSVLNLARVQETFDFFWGPPRVWIIAGPSSVIGCRGAIKRSKRMKSNLVGCMATGCMCIFIDTNLMLVKV